MRGLSHFVPASTVLLFSLGMLSAATLHVGVGQPYSTPCAAIAAAAPGDTILIEAANSYMYNGDVCQWYKDGLTLRGVNGRPKIYAQGKYADGKGIWVIDGNNTVIENVELTGARVPDGNGAAIRLEAPNLIIRNCYIHDNQDGLLTGNGGTGDILIEYSEFAYNGTGNGYTHNIYVGLQGSLTMRFSYSHDAKGGQLVKSRAAVNHILYNRLTTENGTTSYEVDLPNGGLSYVIGNLIQQGIYGQNSNILEYMIEGADPHNPDHRLFVVNNTFVNNMKAGTFALISSADTTPAVIQNNIFYGPGQITTQSSAVLSHNISNVDPLFVNQSSYDYHLKTGSPAINAGTAPGSGAGESLNPDYEYVHPTCGETRTAVGTIDVGAYEFGNIGSALSCTTSTGTGAAGLASLSVSPTAVTGGTNTTLTAMLDNPAPSGGIVVTLTSSNGSAASTVSSIPINAGSLGASSAVTTGGVSSSTNVTLTASYNGVSKTAVLTVNPPLAITGVQATNITSSSATIAWTTNAPSTSQVNYGTTTAYGSTSALNSTAVVSHSVALAGLLPATTYHFRVLSTGTAGQAASGDFTFTTSGGAYSVSVSPLSAAGFSLLTASWTAPAGTPTNDRLILVAVGAPNSAYVAQASTLGATSGTRTLIAPGTAGQYEVRYLLGGSNALEAHSPAISVTPPVGYSLVAPASGQIGGTLTVSWTAPAGHPSNDWVALYSTTGTRYWYQYTGGATSGSFTLPSPAVAGQYEFRYYIANTFTKALTSTSFPVQ